MAGSKVEDGAPPLPCTGDDGQCKPIVGMAVGGGLHRYGEVGDRINRYPLSCTLLELLYVSSFLDRGYLID